MDPKEKKTLILGASPNPDRASYQAMVSLKRKGIPFIAVGRRNFEWDGMKITSDLPEITGPVHTVALYLNAGNQEKYYDYILSLSPARIIFNPGTGNNELSCMAVRNRIEVVENCLLVMIRKGIY